MKRTRKRILFIFYVVLIGVALLYTLFPSDALRNAIVKGIQREAPELQVSIGELKPAFPPALSIKDVELLDKKSVLFSADRLILRPRWISLLTSEKLINFQAVAYQGRLSGVFSSMKQSGTDRLSVTGKFSEIQLGQISSLQEKLDVGLSGRASGQFHFDDISAQQALGGGKFFITDCTVIPSLPVLEIDRLNFQRIDLEFTVDGNRFELQQSVFQGDELDAILSGNIIFEAPADRSLLELDINVTPRRLFLSKLDNTVASGFITALLSEKDNFNFRVTGSLGTPKVSYGDAR